MQLHAFRDIELTEDLLDTLIAEHDQIDRPRYERYWSYYRNPITFRATSSEPSASRPYTLAQEAGLPARLRRRRATPLHDDRAGAPEIVIENDIRWRIDALVDFIFGEAPVILSTAPETGRRRIIQQIIDTVLEASGGIALLQDMALLASVHGFVDLLVRTSGLAATASPPASSASLDTILERAARLRIELIEAPRAIPILDPGDYRALRAYVVRTEQTLNETDRPGAPHRFLQRLTGRAPHPARRRSEFIEIISPAVCQHYRDGALISTAPNLLAELPIVHIQNISQPFHYAGLSDVEPLIPIQDEINTRLSDRAHRVTFQSFRMYLARGLDGFGQTPVGPGQVWSTDNPDASIESFGGDASSPSEAQHIQELREAMDKISSVSPAVLGIIRAKLGHLSSENALRITFMGILARTMRKRIAFQRGLGELSRLILRSLDVTGIFPNAPEERHVRLQWPDPLPIDENDRLRTALLKRDLGIPSDTILAELGYAPADPGIT